MKETTQTIAKKDSIIVAGILAILFFLGLISSVYYPRLNDWFENRSGQAILLNADPACNPSDQPCTIGDTALTVTLNLAEQISPLKAFPVSVSLTGTVAAMANQVTIDFSMIGMNMGINRFALHRQIDNLWQGQALLPVCSMGRRDWQVTVEIASNTSYLARFNLIVNH